MIHATLIVILGLGLPTPAVQANATFAQQMRPQMQNRPTRFGVIPFEKTRTDVDWSPSVLEKPAPFVPAQPMSPDDAKRLEARKLYVVGYMQKRRGQAAAALETLRKALEADTKSPSVLGQLVDVCLQLGLENDAMQYCKRAIEADPTNVNLLIIFARESEKRGGVDEALRAYELAARSPELRNANPQGRLEVNDRLAALYERKGDKSGAVRVLREIVAVLEAPDKRDFDPAVIRHLARPELRISYHERLARNLRALKQPDEAIRVLERVLAMAPTAHRGRLTFEMAVTHFEAGRFPAALAELEKCIALQLQDEQLYVLYEKTLAQLGRDKELVGSLAAAVAKDANNPVLRLFYAKKLLERKELAAAEEQLQRLGNRAESFPLFVQLYRQRREPDKLLDALVASLGNPNSQELLERQIVLLSQDGDLVNSIADVARKRRGQTTDPKTTVANPGASFLVAVLAVRAKNIGLTQEFRRFCLADRPGINLLSMEWELSELLWEAERYAELVTLCGEIQQRQPAPPVFLRYHALALEMQGKTDDALKTAQKMIESATESRDQASALMVAARIHQHARQYDKAEEVCKRVIDQFNELEARYVLSHILTLKGEQTKAEEQLLKLIETDPQQVPPALRAAANNDLGYMWADDGRHLDRAESMIRTAIELHAQIRESGQPPKANAAYLDSLGWVLFKKGKLADALAELNKAVAAQDGDDPVIWDHVGDVHRQLGNPTQAKVAWEKSIVLFDKKKDSYPDYAKKREAVKTKLKLIDTAPRPKKDAATSP